MKYFTILACLAVSAVSISACTTGNANDDAGFAVSRTAGDGQVDTVFTDTSSTGGVFNDKMAK